MTATAMDGSWMPATATDDKAMAIVPFVSYSFCAATTDSGLLPTTVACYSCYSGSIDPVIRFNRSCFVLSDILVDRYSILLSDILLDRYIWASNLGNGCSRLQQVVAKIGRAQSIEYCKKDGD